MHTVRVSNKLDIIVYYAHVKKKTDKHYKMLLNYFNLCAGEKEKKTTEETHTV